jgi:mRNA interferase MazF
LFDYFSGRNEQAYSYRYRCPDDDSRESLPHTNSVQFHKKKGQIVLDQIRTIDKTRLVKNLGAIDSETQLKVISVLQRLFAF